MMISLICLGHTFFYEMEHVVRMFFPGVQVKKADALPGDAPERVIVTSLCREKELELLRVEVKFPEYSESTSTQYAVSEGEADSERLLGVDLYRLLEKATGITPPWGILTGVRPVRLCRQWEEQGLLEAQIRDRFCHDYLVQPAKMKLAMDTAEAQRTILAGNTPDSYSLYISIPFCPTRCLYCSFVSHDMAKAAKLMPDYLRLLQEELRATAELAQKLGLKLQTIYVGGGTPTSLTAEDLALVLSAVEQHFDFNSLLEYTVEAGRPDTISPEKLAVLRKFGVGRISINPQTMDDTILESIGRRHTASQVEESYHLARKSGFDAINMDLIAGLPGETRESFCHTLERVLELNPENITLHTLTVKKSSHLRESEDAYAGSPLALGELLDMAQQRFGDNGYRPYYLYRQKGTVQNLENTGFSKPGYEGIYNVYSMEEMHTILAVGAGGVSKLCCAGDIQRVYNFKYPYEYIGRFEEILARKSSVEEFYARHSGKEIHPR